MPGEKLTRIPDSFRSVWLHQTRGERDALPCRFDKAFELPTCNLTLLPRAEIEGVIFRNCSVTFALPSLARSIPIQLSNAAVEGVDFIFANEFSRLVRGPRTF